MIKSRKKIFVFSLLSSFLLSLYAQGVYYPSATQGRENHGMQNQGLVAEEEIPLTESTYENSKPQVSEKKSSKKKKNLKIKKSKEEKKAEKEAKKAAKKVEKENKKLLKKQKTDKYTGWIYIPEKKFSISNGQVKIMMNGRTGSFGLYALPENLKPVSLLSTYDSFNSSFFSVKIGNKIYKLNRADGVKTEARRTPYGAQMAYSVGKKAQIVLDFSFLPSIASSSRVDMVRVTVYVINLEKRIQSYAIKGVFDTILGENSINHFSTAATRKINSEKQFVSMSNDLWIRSADESTSVQFLLNGKGISVPQYVTMANKDSFSKVSWIPVAQELKSFSSVLSYNNSALGINWKTAYLDPLKTDVITFYISVATDGNEPAGKDFLDSLAKGKTALSAKLPDFIPKTSKAPDPQTVESEKLKTPYWENMPVIPNYVEPEHPQYEEEEDVVEYEDNGIKEYVVGDDEVYLPFEKKEFPVIKEDKDIPRESSVVEKKKLQDPKLDPVYIQNILDRIEEIEKDSKSADLEELKLLNAELDEIFSKLRGLN